MEFQTGVIYLEATGDLTEGYLRYRFEGLIFRGAYFRNFTVSDERSFLNRRNTTVPNQRREGGENLGNEDSAPLLKINMADGIILI